MVNVNVHLIDSSESDSAVIRSVAEADAADVQAATVEVDSEQIALYKGNREYQAITVEHYCIGIHQLNSPMSICINFNCCMFSVNVLAKVFDCCGLGKR